MSAITRQPLPVEMLLTTDQRRLREATDTRRPLPTSNIEECEQLDEDLAADPLCDRPPQRRSGKATSRLLNLLDELERRER